MTASDPPAARGPKQDNATRSAVATTGTKVANPSAYPGFGLTQRRTGRSQSAENRGRTIASGTEQRHQVVQPDDRAQNERRRNRARERAHVVVTRAARRTPDEQRADASVSTRPTLAKAEPVAAIPTIE